MNFLIEHSHSGGHHTEKAAAAKAEEHSTSLKKQILQVLDSRGEEGSTPDEFSEQTGNLINTVRRRFTDLWKEGKIRHHSFAVRKNRSGNECVVWVLGEDSNRQSRLEVLQQEIERLRNLCIFHGVDPDEELFVI